MSSNATRCASGLEDTPLDEGYHTIDTRLAVLEEELRRMRTVIAAGAR